MVLANCYLERDGMKQFYCMASQKWLKTMLFYGFQSVLSLYPSPFTCSSSHGHQIAIWHPTGQTSLLPLLTY